MIPRRIAASRPLISQPLRFAIPRSSLAHPRFASSLNQTATGANVVEETDPNMNGGYVNPPPIKRALRDPYADWWDKQERRNFGEPVHEDNDVLGVFSTEPYTHAKPVKAWLSLGTFVVTVFGLCAVVYQVYPDKPSAPRTFASGLETELGGTRALLARKDGEDKL